jgi:hypothetical protein
MRVAIPPLPNMPSGRGVWLTTGTTLPLPFYNTENQLSIRKSLYIVVSTLRQWWNLAIRYLSRDLSKKDKRISIELYSSVLNAPLL